MANCANLLHLKCADGKVKDGDNIGVNLGGLGCRETQDFGLGCLGVVGFPEIL